MCPHQLLQWVFGKFLSAANLICSYVRGSTSQQPCLRNGSRSVEALALDLSEPTFYPGRQLCTEGRIYMRQQWPWFGKGWSRLIGFDWLVRWKAYTSYIHTLFRPTNTRHGALQSCNAAKEYVGRFSTSCLKQMSRRRSWGGTRRTRGLSTTLRRTSLRLTGARMLVVLTGGRRGGGSQVRDLVSARVGWPESWSHIAGSNQCSFFRYYHIMSYMIYDISYI